MRMKFYNEYGSVDFSGSSADSIPFKLLAAEGLNPVDKAFTTAVYEGCDGAFVTDTSVGARTITLAGDVPPGDGFLRQYAHLMEILDAEGWLEVHRGYSARKIRCRCSSFTPGDRYGGYRTYVIQFMCEYPYFQDLKETEEYIFRRVNNIDDSFALPGVFTNRVSQKSIFYRGSVKTHPRLVIKVLSDGGEGESLVITNLTHNESITLSYKGSEGEEITIDTENCKIYNSSGDNLIKYISDDTFLDKFCLYRGENDIEARLFNSALNLSVSCVYSNKYLEAGC